MILEFYVYDIFVNSFLTFSKDINESLRNTHSCHINATCTNTVGSFYCTCNVVDTKNGTFCTGEYTYCMFLYYVCNHSLYIRYFTNNNIIPGVNNFNNSL